ncbi:MAG: CatB-related O-acetyltransferase [Crocinitomicaceae bacterium]|nr:CatB-related O-acetyltransferase [Crocinitomicaceae bacterium]
MLRKVIGNIKRNFQINFVYPSRFKGSHIESYIPSNLSLGEEIIIEENISMSAKIKSIGNGTYIGCRSVIGNCESIGNYCSISKDVKIGMSNHPLDLVSTSPRFYLKKYGKVSEDLYNHDKIKPTIIQDDVLISSNVVILENLTIGRGAVIAAGAVVTENVEPYSIVGGVPARHIKFRFDKEKIERLMSLDYGNDQEIMNFK